MKTIKKEINMKIWAKSVKDKKDKNLNNII